VHQLLDGSPLKMNSITYEELKGLQRTFPLYARLPEDLFPQIRLAEKFDDAGNRVFNQLKHIFLQETAISPTTQRIPQKCCQPS
jgi:hypothetical protein